MDGAGKSQAFADALAKFGIPQELATKLDAGSGGSNASPSPAAPISGFKRGLDDFSSEEPDAKRPAAMADPFGTQLAATKGVGGLGPGPLTANGLGIKTGIGVSGCEKSCQEEIKIPDPLVVQLAPDIGQDRPCYLPGSKEAIEQAKEIVMEIVSSKSHESGSITSNLVKGAAGVALAQGQFEMMIPDQKVGLIIGKEGETIRTLQDKSGTKMFMLQDNMFEECNNKPLRSVGEPTFVEVSRSKQRIDKFQRDFFQFMDHPDADQKFLDKNFKDLLLSISYIRSDARVDVKRIKQSQDDKKFFSKRKEELIAEINKMKKYLKK